MNEANTPTTASPELPAPKQEAGKEAASQPAEKQTAAQESVGQQAPPPGSGISTDDAQAAVQAATTDQPAEPASQPSATPAKDSPTADLHASDGDLIEKQWVERAKAIVSSTQEDPYKQKSEMSKAKADYIKKRFNKVIKTE